VLYYYLLALAHTYLVHTCTATDVRRLYRCTGKFTLSLAICLRCVLKQMGWRGQVWYHGWEVPQMLLGFTQLKNSNYTRYHIELVSFHPVLGASLII